MSGPIHRTFVDYLPQLYRIAEEAESILEFERRVRSVFEEIGPTELIVGKALLRFLLEEMDGQIKRWENEKGEPNVS